MGSIYTAPAAQPITFSVGDPDLEKPLGGGFQAAHVQVNNPTNQAIYFPDADNFVPAGVSNCVLALKNTDVARASFTIPAKFGLIQPPPLAGAAQLIFSAARVDISPQAGTPAFPTPPFPGSVIPVLKQLATGASFNTTVNPPLGALIQLIGVCLTVPFAQCPSVKVTGVQTGFVYFNSLVTGTVQFAIQAADTGLQVSASGGVSTTVNALTNGIVVSIGPTQPASWPGGYDGQAISAPASGTKATVTLLANATRRWMADHISAGLTQSTGAVTAQNLNLIDGPSGGANLLDQQPLALTATVSTADRLEQENLHFHNAAINTALTAEFAAGVAGVFERVSLGAYLQ